MFIIFFSPLACKLHVNEAFICLLNTREQCLTYSRPSINIHQMISPSNLHSDPASLIHCTEWEIRKYLLVSVIFRFSYRRVRFVKWLIWAFSTFLGWKWEMELCQTLRMCLSFLSPWGMSSLFARESSNYSSILNMIENAFSFEKWKHEKPIFLSSCGAFLAEYLDVTLSVCWWKIPLFHSHFYSVACHNYIAEASIPFPITLIIFHFYILNSVIYLSTIPAGGMSNLFWLLA